jgi:hypothetical protein
MSSSNKQAVAFESLNAMIEMLTYSVSTNNTRLSNVELNHADRGHYSNNPSFEDIGVDEVLGLKIENIIKKNSVLKVIFLFLKRTCNVKRHQLLCFISFFLNLYCGMILITLIFIIQDQ